MAADSLVTLAYFAVVDWLYMARLAGYVFIVEAPQALLAPSAPVPPPRHGPPLQTTIDRNELILSDVPSPSSADRPDFTLQNPRETVQLPDRSCSIRGGSPLSSCFLSSQNA